MTENSQNRVAWPVAWGQAPIKGSRAMLQQVDFTMQNPVGISLVYEQDSDRIEYVQALYVDNSLNPSALVCFMHGTSQQIIIPAGYQAYIPVLATSDNCRMTFSTVGNTAIVPVQFLSFPLPLAVWSAAGIGLGQDFSANKPALAANLIATIPVNAGRAYFEVQNQDVNDIQVVLDNGAGVNLSVIILAAGAGANMQGGSYSNTTFKGRVRIFSANAAPQIELRQE